jgi:hypothetical protein
VCVCVSRRVTGCSESVGFTLFSAPAPAPAKCLRPIGRGMECSNYPHALSVVANDSEFMMLLQPIGSGAPALRDISGSAGMVKYRAEKRL